MNAQHRRFVVSNDICLVALVGVGICLLSSSSVQMFFVNIVMIHVTVCLLIYLMYLLIVSDSTGNILQNITNTMTDRCVVNSKVNSYLEATRESAGINKSLNAFFCGTHPLDSFAKSADTVLQQYELKNNVTSQCLQSRSMSATQALSNAVSKMAFKDGAGVPAELRAFLSMKKIKKMPILYFVGTRFHVMFHNGGAVYYLKSLLEEFIVKVWGAPNRLIQAVKNDLKSCELVTGSPWVCLANCSQDPGWPILWLKGQYLN